MKSADKTAVYVRVSTKSQDTASQEPDLTRWVEAHGGQATWYRDTARGEDLDRPGWRKLWAEVEAGRVKRIVVWRMDRAGRSIVDLTRLIRELGERGVSLVSVRDSFDLGTPAGKLMAHLLASVAQYETEIRRERVAAGIAAARAAGRKIGGSSPGRLRSDGSPKAHAIHPDRVKHILELDTRGEPRASIARLTGVPPASVYRILGDAGRRMGKPRSRVAPAPH